MPVTVRRLPEPPEWLDQFILRKEHCWLHDIGYEYAVIDTAALRREYPTVPHLFAMNQNGFVAVSDTLDYSYERALAAYHEWIEFDGELHEHACLDTLKKELEAAKYFNLFARGLRDYVVRRWEFFNCVVEYYQAKTERTPEEEAILKRLLLSRAYLSTLIENEHVASRTG